MLRSKAGVMITCGASLAAWKGAAGGSSDRATAAARRAAAASKRDVRCIVAGRNKILHASDESRAKKALTGSFVRSCGHGCSRGR